MNQFHRTGDDSDWVKTIWSIGIYQADMERSRMGKQSEALQSFAVERCRKRES